MVTSSWLSRQPSKSMSSTDLAIQNYLERTSKILLELNQSLVFSMISGVELPRTSGKRMNRSLSKLCKKLHQNLTTLPSLLMKEAQFWNTWPFLTSLLLKDHTTLSSCSLNNTKTGNSWKESETPLTIFHQPKLITKEKTQSKLHSCHQQHSSTHQLNNPNDSFILFILINFIFSDWLSSTVYKISPLIKKCLKHCNSDILTFRAEAKFQGCFLLILKLLSGRLDIVLVKLMSGSRRINKL